MHDLEFDHHHESLFSDSERDAMARSIWEQDTLELLTVGIDIGSSTTHLLFARITLVRQKHDLSSRFVVADRKVVWRSPIRLTPFLPNGTIDAQELRQFFAQCYRDAGYARDDVDSGAVILTGEAIKRTNARAIDEIFASESGKFVCATAGHKLESILAAHGSGATTLSRKKNGVGLHVDIGGGTTKLALVDRGEVVGVAAFAVGGRLLAKDKDERWSRIDESAQIVGKSLGIEMTPETLIDEGLRIQIARRLATLVVDQIVGTPLDDLGRELLLTEPLTRDIVPEFISFSGGVSEYVFGQENADFGDIAQLLAAEIVAQLPARVTLPIIDAGQRIRATVIGASQFTVQVSGKTLYLSDSAALPVHNVPVVHLNMQLPEVIDADLVASALVQSAARQDHDPSSMLAFAFTWTGLPDYPRLLAMAQAIKQASAPNGRRENLLVLVIDGDVGQSIGRILDQELGLGSHVIAIDGVQLKDLDFVDLGELLNPPGVVPVVIKSLLFS